MTFCGKKGLVLGSGTSGRGAMLALKKLGAEAIQADTEYLPEEITGCDFAVVSPGIRHDHPVYKYAREHDMPVYGEIGLGAMLNKAPVIGVTGTNGKTTTVSMLGSVYEAAGVRAAVCGNIGRSFAEAACEGGCDRVILELSSFQLLQAAPLKVHIACITNLSADHLDYHGNMLEYRHAKLKIADGQTPEDFLIVPEKLNLVGMRGSPTLLAFGRDCYEKEGRLYVMGAPFMRADELKAGGRHNVQNALNAALAAFADGIPPAAIRDGLMSFVPGDYRISPAGVYNGCAFYNDSKGTNIGATLAAARCMTGSTALIAGGSDKGYDYDELFRGLPGNVTAVFVTGGNSAGILESAARMGYAGAVACDSLGDAVRRAASGGFDSVLFSPASASFDRYANYEERGRAFESEVKKLFGSTS